MDEKTEQSAAAEDTAGKQNLPAGGSDETGTKWTDATVDAYVKQRIDKQNAKHATEMDELRQRLSELEAKATEAETKAAELQANAEREQWLRKASEATGVPASLLRGTSEEEILAHAKAIADTIPGYPTMSGGNGNNVPKPTKEEILSIQNERERLKAIRDNIELFQQ